MCRQIDPHGVFRNEYAAFPVTGAFTNGNPGPIVPALPTAGTLKLTAITENSD